MIWPRLNCACECEIPPGPFDYFGDVVGMTDTPPNVNAPLTGAYYKNQLYRDAARCDRAIANSIVAGIACYAGPTTTRDFAQISSTLACGDFAWYMRWANIDNPTESSSTNYVATAMSSWSYDAGVNQWDATDSAVESLINATPPPGGYNGVRAWAGPATTIPNNTVLQFTAVVEHRDFATVTLKFENFITSQTLTAVATITPGSEVVGVTTGTAHLQAYIAPQGDGTVKILAWFTTNASATTLAAAKVTLSCSVPDDGSIDIGDGTIVRSVKLRKAERPGLDLVCVRADTQTRVASWYLRDDRVKRMSYSGSTLTLAQQTAHETAGNFFTGTGGREYCDRGDIGEWGPFAFAFGTFGITEPRAWCNDAKLGRITPGSNSPGAVWEYNSDGSTRVAKVGYTLTQPGLFAEYGVSWPKIVGIPARDYPNVFGVKNSGSVFTITYGEIVEHTATDASGTYPVLIGPSTALYSATGVTGQLRMCDAIDGQSIAVVREQASGIDRVRLIINGAVVESNPSTTHAVFYVRVYAHRVDDEVKFVIIDRGNTTGDFRVRVLDGGSVVWAANFASSITDRSRSYPNNLTYSAPLPAVDSGSDRHLYLVGLNLCDDRIVLNPNGPIGGEVAKNSWHNVMTWDGEWTWPMSRFGAEANSGAIVVERPINSDETPHLDTVKRSADVPQCPTEHLYANATCTL